MRIESSEPEVGVGSNDEEGQELMEGIQPGEVQIAAIHDIERPGFEEQLVEDVDVVDFSMDDLDKRGNRSSQIEQRVQHDRAFSFAKPGPREQGQTQIDGGRVERIGGLVQVGEERVVDIQLLGQLNQHVGKVGKETPIPMLVGIRQRASGDGPSNAHVIELGGLGSQTGLDVSQAFPVRQLGKSHAEKLIERGEALGFVVAAILFDAAAKFVQGDMVHHLNEDGSSNIHRSSLPVGLQKDGQKRMSKSNR